MTAGSTSLSSGTSEVGLLAPYRVLDLTDERALFAGSMLGRLGADVIQVEPPSGSSARRVPPFSSNSSAGQNSLFWSAYASGKRGVTCALDRPEGRALLHRLAKKADILFENEGASTHSDLRFNSLRKINPRLIYVTLTGFGVGGPKSQYAESDLILWAAGGPLWPNRDHHGTPYRNSVPQSHLHAAGDAATGALVALLARSRTGRGQHVEVSAQQSVALTCLSGNFASILHHPNFSIDSPTWEDDPARIGQRKLVTKWRAKDGFVQMQVYAGPAMGGYTNKLFDWARSEGDIPHGVAAWDWTELPRLLENGEVTQSDISKAYEAIGNCLAKHTKREILDIVLTKRLQMAPGFSVDDICEDAHFLERGLFDTVLESETPRTLPSRLALTSSPSHVPLKAAPQLGQHNFEVYGELLGLQRSDIVKLKEREIL